jgi:hypothetical protein
MRLHAKVNVQRIGHGGGKKKPDGQVSFAKTLSSQKSNQQRISKRNQ